MGRADIAWIVGLALLSLALRGWVVEVTPSAPRFLDMAEYWDRGVHIWQSGELYRDSWRMPGLPAALATAFAVAGGPSLDAARWLNVIAGTATVVLVYLLARRTAGRPAATVAALIVIAYPSFLAYSTLVATETLVTLPLTGALLAVSFPSRRALAVGGLLAAVTALVRPAGIAVLPAVLAAPWLAWPRVAARERLTGAALALFVFTLAMTPWWLHGLRLHGRLVPLDTTGGINLLLGNGPSATGLLKTSQLLRIQREQLPGVDTSTPQGADRAARVARDHVRTHPFAALALWPAKLAGLFAIEGREHAYLYSVSMFGELSATSVRWWGVVTMVSFPLLMAAALLGLTVPGGLTAGVRAPALCYLGIAIVMHLATFGDPRLHLPFVPVLAVVTTALAQRARRGVAPRRLAVALALFALLMVAWIRQVPPYLRAIEQLTAPGGHSRALDYDTLL